VKGRAEGKKKNEAGERTPGEGIMSLEGQEVFRGVKNGLILAKKCQILTNFDQYWPKSDRFWPFLTIILGPFRS
jgi:hypothetical protein